MRTKEIYVKTKEQSYSMIYFRKEGNLAQNEARIQRKTKGKAIMSCRVNLNKQCLQKLVMKVDGLETQGRVLNPKPQSCSCLRGKLAQCPCARLEKRMETFIPLGRLGVAVHHWGSY